MMLNFLGNLTISRLTISRLVKQKQEQQRKNTIYKSKIRIQHMRKDPCLIESQILNQTEERKKKDYL